MPDAPASLPADFFQPTQSNGPTPDTLPAEFFQSDQPAHFTADATAKAKTVGGFIHNLLSSTTGFLGNLGHSIMHPIDTAEKVAAIPWGALEHVVDRPILTAVGAVPPNMPDTPREQVWGSFVNNLKQRYGSVDKLTDTMYTDPIGFAADLSTLAGGASALAKGAGLARVGAAADTVAAVTNPLNAAIKPVEAVAARLAPSLYQGVLKPNLNNSLENMDQMVQTGLSEGINPASRQGLTKLRSLIGDVQQTINQGIQQRAQAGATVDPYAVASRVAGVRDRFQSVDAAKDLAAIDAVRQRFLSQSSPPWSNTAFSIPLDEAQQMKVNTNAIIGQKMGEQGTAVTEAQKALVRGLKEEIENVFPEVKNLNAREGALIGLEPAIEQSVKRIGNQSFFDTNLTTTGLVSKILANPWLRGKLAIGIQNGSFAKKLDGAGRAIVVGDRLDRYVNDLQGAETPPR